MLEHRTEIDCVRSFKMTVNESSVIRIGELMRKNENHQKLSYLLTPCFLLSLHFYCKYDSVRHYKKRGYNESRQKESKRPSLIISLVVVVVCNESA